MENILELNSDKLKREIRLKIKLYEDMLQKNIENDNIHDLKDYVFLLFYDTLPLKEDFKRLITQPNEEKKNVSNENKTDIEEENETTNEGNKENEENEQEEEEEEERGVSNIQNVPKATQEEIQKLKSLYQDPEGEFERYFETLFSYIENNENQLPAIKAKYDEIIKSKFMEIHEKLKSCDKQIQFLESLYVQRELQQKIPLTGVERIQFIIKDQNIFGEMGYGPSELFARYIFTIVFSKMKNEKANVNKEKSISDRFYEDGLFNNMNNSFKDWKKLLQFWFVYVLLIQQLFKKEANVDELLQEKKLMELAKKIRALKSKEERKKDKKGEKGKKGKKGKKQRGGDPPLKKSAPELFSEWKKQKHKISKNQQKNGASNIYKELMKKIVIRRNQKNQDIYSYFNGTDFQKAIADYYEDEIDVKPTCNLQLPYIGDKLEKFSLKLIMNCDKKRQGEREIEKTEVIRKLKDRITIFQTLYSYNAQNQSDIQRFLSSLYDEVLYFYFMIYYKKKFIYMRYLEIFKSVLRQKGISYEGWIQNKNQQQDKNQNTNVEKENIPNDLKNSSNQNKNKLNENQQNRYASLSPNQITKIKEVESKIKVLEQKREELEKNRNQPNFDKKILLIEKYIHELILEKRKLY